MNANSTFLIGKDHETCEDYALSGYIQPLDLAYAIVCDGCSASPDVDIGARILALSARETLLDGTQITDSISFGKATIRKAAKLFQAFPSIHSQALDATLLIAWVQNKMLTLYMYGDGVFIHKTKNGVATVHISFQGGAPDYLSYWFDERRLGAYYDLPENKKIISVNVNDTEYVGSPLVPYTFNIPVDDGDVISVISDGINSFRKADYTQIPWKDLIDEFTGYKNFEGEFVLRRISAFKRKCLKEGITHSDDISISTILV